MDVCREGEEAPVCHEWVSVVRYVTVDHHRMSSTHSSPNTSKLLRSSTSSSIKPIVTLHEPVVSNPVLSAFRISN